MNELAQSLAPVCGEWWIDTRDPTPEPYTPPPHRVVGELHAGGFTDWRLETSGSLVEGVPVWPGSLPAAKGPQSIWGVDLSGNLYSLLHAEHVGINHRSRHPHGGTQRWHAGVIAQSGNAWVSPEDEVDQLNIHLRDLATWIQDPESNVDYDHETGTVTAPPETRTAVAYVGGKKVELRWGTDREFPTDSAGTSVHITPSASIRIEGDQPISEINEHWVQPLRNLFALFSMLPCVVTRVHARLAGLSDDSDETEAWHHPRVEMRFPQPFIEGPSASLTDADDNLSWHEMLATRATLANEGLDFDKLLPAFFSSFNGNWAETALDHLIDSQEKQRGFTFDDMFLYAFKGIESLHTHWTGNERDQLHAIVADCFARCGDTAAKLRSACGGIEQALRDERNDVVHPRKRRQGSARQIALLNAVQWLLRHSLLQAMGLSGQACDTIITNNMLFTRVLRRLEAV